LVVSGVIVLLGGLLMGMHSVTLTGAAEATTDCGSAFSPKGHYINGSAGGDGLDVCGSRLQVDGITVQIEIVLGLALLGAGVAARGPREDAH
jgi:hypothetical protein